MEVETKAGERLRLRRSGAGGLKRKKQLRTPTSLPRETPTLPRNEYISNLIDIGVSPTQEPTGPPAPPFPNGGTALMLSRSRPSRREVGLVKSNWIGHCAVVYSPRGIDLGFRKARGIVNREHGGLGVKRRGLGRRVSLAPN
jgi:hypothetical protein